MSEFLSDINSASVFGSLKTQDRRALQARITHLQSIGSTNIQILIDFDIQGQFFLVWYNSSGQVCTSTYQKRPFQLIKTEVHEESPYELSFYPQFY